MTVISMKWSFAALCLFGFWLLPDCAIAQVNIQSVEITGTIVSLAPNSITIRQDDKTLVADISTIRRLPGGGILEMAPPTILVRGQQSTDMLQRGMLVRFVAEVERFRRIKEPLTELTVFSRSEFTELGFLNPQVDLPDLAVANLEDAGKGKNDNAKAVVQDFLVAGIVETARPGRITVIVPHPDGEKKLTVNLADDAVLNLEVTDLSLVRVGNKISAKGEAIRLPQFFAAEVEIFIDPDKKLLARRKAEEGMQVEPAAVVVAGPFGDVQPKDAAQPKAGEADAAQADKEFKAAPQVKVNVGEGAKPAAEDRLLPDGRRKRGLRGRVIKIN